LAARAPAAVASAILILAGPDLRGVAVFFAAVLLVAVAALVFAAAVIRLKVVVRPLGWFVHGSLLLNIAVSFYPVQQLRRLGEKTGGATCTTKNLLL